MNAVGESDDFVVLSTQVNKAATAVAESVEGRRSPKGSIVELSPMLRTQSRIEHQIGVARQSRLVAEFPRSFDLTEEPYDVVRHVRICAGGGWQQPSLPRCIILSSGVQNSSFRVTAMQKLPLVISVLQHGGMAFSCAEVATSPRSIWPVCRISLTSNSSVPNFQESG